MNKSSFLELLKKVSNISDQHKDELEKVAAAFPYCQTAHLLLAKSAFDQGSMLSAQRLRKASSYATDRQVLKNIIYNIPVYVADAADVAEAEARTVVPEVYVIEQPVEEALPIPAVRQQETVLENIIPFLYTKEEYVEDLISSAATEDALAEHEAVAQSADEEAAVENEPEAENGTAARTASQSDFDAELASLLTLNSLSPSSTDLLSQEKPLLLQETNPAPEPAQAFAPEQAETAGQPAAEQETEHSPVEHALLPGRSAAASTSEKSRATAADDSLYEEDLPESLPTPEEGAVSYSSSEIDRLYLEDALGYAMGSSRMGEVLQLKDGYTRQKPQGFHPELILEYSKTHEIEKAVQPTANLLSQELDLIDQFLKLNPRLKTMANFRVKSEPQEDLSLKCSKIKKGIASESLANIFLKQGKVKKAIKIYEQLVLKNPEKKAYFAEQIEKLQNQI